MRTCSLELLLERDDAVYWPTHGPAITEPKAHVQAFIEHRQERVQQILDCLGSGYDKIADMVPAMYVDTPEFMYPAAGRSVFAAIEYLVARGAVVCDGELSLDASYTLKG